MKTGPAPDESPVFVFSDNTVTTPSDLELWALMPVSAIFQGFGSRGWNHASISPKPYKLWTWHLHHWIQPQLRFKMMCRNIVTASSGLELWAREVSYFHGFGSGGSILRAGRTLEDHNYTSPRISHSCEHILEPLVPKSASWSRLTWPFRYTEIA